MLLLPPQSPKLVPVKAEPAKVISLKSAFDILLVVEVIVLVVPYAVLRKKILLITLAVERFTVVKVWFAPKLNVQIPVPVLAVKFNVVIIFAALIVTVLKPVPLIFNVVIVFAPLMVAVELPFKFIMLYVKPPPVNGFGEPVKVIVDDAALRVKLVVVCTFHAVIIPEQLNVVVPSVNDLTEDPDVVKLLLPPVAVTVWLFVFTAPASKLNPEPPVIVRAKNVK